LKGYSDNNHKLKIATKITLALVSVASSMLVLFCAFQRPQLINNFEKLQKQKALENINRSRDVILTELSALEKQSQDWGSWDDTYKYAVDRNQEFRTTNLVDSTFTVSHFDIIWILNNKSEVVYGKSRLPNGKLTNSMEGFDPVALAKFSIDKRTKVDQGINVIAGFPTALCVRPILSSNEIGASHGTLILGRYLTKPIIKAMNDSTHVPFELLNAQSTTNVLANSTIAQQLIMKNGNYVEDPTTTKSVNGFAFLEDTAKKQSVLIQSQTDPDILRQGTETVQKTLISMIAISVAATIIGLSLISLTVSKPLTILARKVESLSDTNFIEFDASTTNRQDEIGVVAQSFGGLMKRLEKAQMRIMTTSRDAGMAEVARGILHNAGNVLNSTVVSAEQISQIVKDSDPAGLRMSIQLMEDNRGDLDSYLKDDPKGSKLLPYLLSLAEKLEARHIQALSECASMMTSTHHLGEVVRGQEALARKQNTHCKFHIKGVITEVETILSSSLNKHGIDLRVTVDDSIIGYGDPAKLTQVLINLIVNAKEAVADNPKGSKQVDISINQSENGEIEIEVTDNGSGITSEPVESIFGSGFSTKQGGTGLGLHYCANSLAEMGWRITAHNNAEGVGCTFTLTSPSQQQEVAVA
jgi:sensor domain CHASE-containing protein/two-component sensor histidine kinase